MQQRWNAHTAEEELPASKFLDVEQLANNDLGEPQKFHRRRGFRRTKKGGDRLLDTGAVLKDADDRGRIEIDPDRFRIKEGEAAEGVPASRLTPDGEPEEVPRAG